VIDWLNQEFIDTSLVTSTTLLSVPIASYRDNKAALQLRVRSQLTSNRAAVHCRHTNIQEHKIWSICERLFQPCLRAIGLADIVAPQFDQASHAFGRIRVVFDYQNSQ